jgi:hypothetical protein
MLCDYKDILGKPGTGAHSIRVFDFAVVDILLTILLGWVIHKRTKLNLTVCIVSSFLLGIISHRIFCVRSTVDKILFKI